MSVSIDTEDDKQAWKDMIEKNNLKGVQLIATDAWQSDVCQNYAINGIPRFMLFDTEGNVLNLNAPRPNSEEIREIFNELTNESIIEQDNIEESQESINIEEIDE